MVVAVGVCGALGYGIGSVRWDWRARRDGGGNGRTVMRFSSVSRKASSWARLARTARSLERLMRIVSACFAIG